MTTRAPVLSFTGSAARIWDRLVGEADRTEDQALRAVASPAAVAMAVPVILLAWTGVVIYYLLGGWVVSLVRAVARARRRDRITRERSAEVHAYMLDGLSPEEAIDAVIASDQPAQPAPPALPRPPVPPAPVLTRR